MRGIAAVIAAVVLLAIGASSRAEAFIYWADPFANTIDRASSDGTSIQYGFVGPESANAACAIAVDDQFIYWGRQAGGTIGRARLDGSNVQPSFISGLANPCGVAVDSTHIYWADSEQAIGRANLDGSSPDDEWIQTSHVDQCGIAVDNEVVYWAHEGGISRANLNGTAIEPNFAPFITLAPATLPCGVAVNSAHVYWAASGTDSLGRANTDGSGLDLEFITGARNPCGVALDDRHVFWTNSQAPGAAVGRASLNGANPNQSFAAASGLPCGVASDDRRRTSSLALSCGPAAVGPLQPATCTATVSDSFPGPPTSPVGRVTLASSDPSGQLLPATSCQLVASGSASSSCVLSYAGQISANIAAYFDGDASHTGSSATASVAVGAFALGAVTINPKDGTATLGVSLPGPGSVQLAGTDLSAASVQAGAAGPQTLPIAVTGQSRKRLRKRGKLDLSVTATFTPQGGGSQQTGSVAVELLQAKKKKKKKRGGGA